MANFKVGDLVRERNRGVGRGTYSLTNSKSVCEVISDVGSRDEIKVKLLKCWSNKHIGDTYWLDADRMELIEPEATGPKECPTIIKVSKTFTLQIKDITIDLNKSEIEELINQLNEVY